VLLDQSAPVDEPRIHALLLQQSNSDDNDRSQDNDFQLLENNDNKNNNNNNNKQVVDWVRAKFFIDASYDGELMRAAGVTHTIGRESRYTYGESLAGITATSAAQFPIPISPFRTTGGGVDHQRQRGKQRSLLSSTINNSNNETNTDTISSTISNNSSWNNQTTTMSAGDNGTRINDNDTNNNNNDTTNLVPTVNSTEALEEAKISQNDNPGDNHNNNNNNNNNNKTYFYYTKPNDDNMIRYVQKGADPRQQVGDGDDKVMSYSYRVCFTADPNNTVPVTPPDGYNPDDFELARRLVQAQVVTGSSSGNTNNNGSDDVISRPWLLLDYMQYGFTRNSYMKYDACCGRSPFGIDPPGLAVGYANASRAVKRRMAQDHRYFVQGLLWFWYSDPTVPQAIRDNYASYGLCKDEWADNGHFPRQLYIREASRMIGDHVFSQNDRTSDCRQDSIAVATWFFDIHDVQRVAVPNTEAVAVVFPGTESSNATMGRNDTNATAAATKQPSSSSSSPSWMVINEGLVNDEVVDFTPFDLPYWIILPKHGEVTNLAVPNCPSVSHVAFSAIREEPTLWLLGQAAGTAAAIALSHGNPSFHDVDVIRLQQALRSQGSPIHWPADRTC
jgi:hypothetical protein